MRNVFDQYEQPETRLTHALLSSLDAYRRLLAKFVRWVTGETRPRRRLVVHDFEIAETRLAAGNGLAGGTLTMFTGIPFDDAEQYSYPQAKRILELMREQLLHHSELRRKLRVDPDQPGRGAITGTKGRSVWDYIALMGLREVRHFAHYPQLTLDIRDDSLMATLTVPNRMRSRHRRAMLGASFEEFKERIDEVVRGIAAVTDMAKGMRPVIVVVQRHYASQSAPPSYDAVLRFDPRTAVTVTRGRDKGVKTQPQWLRPAYDLFDAKRSNMQFQIGAEFPYERCNAVKSADITEAVAAVWMACAPMLARL